MIWDTYDINNITITSRNTLLGLRFLLLLIFLSGTLETYSQQKFCADSSIRIKYTTPGDPFDLLLNPDTSGTNIFTGGYYNAASHAPLGLIAMKTNWGDSIYWAKKYYSDNNIYLNCRNSYKSPGGTLVLTGERRSFNRFTFLLSKIDTNGNMLWTRYFPFVTGNPTYSMKPNNWPKNILVSNDAIYFSIHLSYWDIVGKLDLNGNLLWSRGVASGSPPFSPGNNIVEGLIEKNGFVYFASNIGKPGPSGLPIYSGVAITQLSEADGSLIKSTIYSIVPDIYAKGFYALYLFPYKDGSFSLTGYVCINTYGSISPQPNTRFNVQIDTDLNSLPTYYYTTNIPPDNTFQFDMNTQKQSIFLINNDANQTKYFVSFDWNQQLLRSRKFIVPSNPFNGGSAINIDDKQNLHFIYNYPFNNQAVTEYARLSDLAPANTLQCFGIDTVSIFQPYPFNLIQEPYTWPFQDTNLVKCLPVNIYTQNAVINKQVVCKQVSYCDSLKIRGNPAVSICLSGADVRYTTYLNPQCLKSINWQTDTSIANIINYEADSAVTIHFNKAGQFYLKALVNNCVVADSILIKVTKPQTALQFTKSDSLLCPGKSILLQVNPLFKTYQWQDGSNQNTYTVTSPGLYSITATDSCGNTVKDSIRIKQDNTVIPIAPYYKICIYDTVNVLLSSNIRNLTWQPPLYGSFSRNKLSLYPLQTTVYSIQAQSAQGCDLQKQVTVETETCPEWVRFPSAFTPNNDGLNDSFKPGVSGHLISYNLKVFDRNGQIVFASNNPFAGWNGTIKGAEQNSGIFVFLCYYRFIDKAQVMDKGTLVLIR